jgi:hypothetical protein
VAADLHHELAELGVAAGQPSGDAQELPFDEGRLPDRVLGAAGIRPAVEDFGHVPGDAELVMLDLPGLQAPASRSTVACSPSASELCGTC